LIPYNECSSASTFRVERNVKKHRRIIYFFLVMAKTLSYKESSVVYGTFYSSQWRLLMAD
jgi:hypothetical protein